MPDHPWFKGIVEHRWTRDQIILGEIQHYLRVRTNPIFFGYIVTNVASERNYALMDVVMENFMEELGGEKTHVDIMLQFLTHAGISREQADRADPAPGTLAAIEMIRSGCQNYSALEASRSSRSSNRCTAAATGPRPVCTRSSSGITGSRARRPRPTSCMPNRTPVTARARSPSCASMHAMRRPR